MNISIIILTSDEKDFFFPNCKTLEWGAVVVNYVKIRNTCIWGQESSRLFFKYMQYTYIVRLHTYTYVVRVSLMLRHDLSFFLSIGFPELFSKWMNVKGIVLQDQIPPWSIHNI